MIGSEIKNEEFAKLLLSDMPLDKNRIIFKSDEKVDISLFKEALTKRPEYSAIECLPRGISLKCVRHLSATIGIMIGIILRLPIYWVLQFGEIFALIFYIWVRSKVLSLTPVKKEIFEIIMLLPMSIQQAASINYDAILLSLYFLLIAYILHIKFDVNEVVDLKNLIYIIKSKKFASLKKPKNPNRFWTCPVAPELFVLCVIPAVFLKGEKNVFADST